MTCRARTWTQNWIPPRHQRVVKVFSAQKSPNKLCGVWVLSKIEPSEGTISMLKPSLDLNVTLLDVHANLMDYTRMQQILVFCQVHDDADQYLIGFDGLVSHSRCDKLYCNFPMCSLSLTSTVVSCWLEWRNSILSPSSSPCRSSGNYSRRL